jgi:hypothetical protein
VCSGDERRRCGDGVTRRGATAWRAERRCHGSLKRRMLSLCRCDAESRQCRDGRRRRMVKEGFSVPGGCWRGIGSSGFSANKLPSLCKQEARARQQCPDHFETCPQIAQRQTMSPSMLGMSSNVNAAPVTTPVTSHLEVLQNHPRDDTERGEVSI